MQQHSLCVCVCVCCVVFFFFFFFWVKETFFLSHFILERTLHKTGGNILLTWHRVRLNYWAHFRLTLAFKHSSLSLSFHFWLNKLLFESIWPCKTWIIQVTCMWEASYNGTSIVLFTKYLSSFGFFFFFFFKKFQLIAFTHNGSFLLSD